ncbi:MATE family efflux transporter [Faecalicatena sp. AGMB00832]|uniref:Probable multidrug resistance protein NorM n=1 Tax=Faecalicatena faecalis TaxID=2726362 RepID=A0ABS6D9G0_9FIRM|nr:MATE family efflux transporter [Faecalicatena faecalis]MBU3878229.1 MATE family efflux transporter [Faecalicatena faecalis]
MDKEYLINQKPARALLVFAFPMIIGNLFQQFYTMADSVVVGQFVGENALAAVGASYSLTNVFISIAIGGGIGASVVTSRTFGSRDYDAMKRSVYTALISFLILSVLLGAFGLWKGSEIMQLLNTPANVLGQATKYLDIYFIGLPFLFMYNVLSAMFNALGKSRIPLYLLIFSSIFNIVLDLYMVYSLGLGVAGVAWATLIAQGISAIASFILFLKELSSYPVEHTALFDTKELKVMTKIALPSILQQSTVSIGMMLVQSVVNSFGSEMLAGFSAAMRVESLCIVPMAAMGNAISPYTAQNIGAKQFERVQKGYHAAYKIVAAFAVLICLSLELFYRPIVMMFLGSEGSQLAINTGISYLRFMGWFFGLIGLKMITDGVLRGAGDMKMFTVANLVNLGLRVCIAVTMAPRFGIAMVWYAVPMGWAANYVISYLQYRTGKWKHISAEHAAS